MRILRDKGLVFGGGWLMASSLMGAPRIPWIALPELVIGAGMLFYGLWPRVYAEGNRDDDGR